MFHPVFRKLGRNVRRWLPPFYIQARETSYHYCLIGVGVRDHAPTNARLNFKEVTNTLAGAWAAAQSNANQWLMFDLGQRSSVGVIRTQGRQAAVANNWVTSYSVSYGNSSGDEMWYKDSNGDTIIFTGNSDRDSLVTHVLNEYSGPFHARYVKFHPVTWYGWVAMRADVGEVAPVGFWPLNRHTQLRDVSGYGNDATGVGVSLGNGVHGESEGAYSFSGSSTSYIEIPNNGILDTRYSVTILAYVYPTGTAGPIVNYRINEFGVHFWQIETNKLFVRMVTRNHDLTDSIYPAKLNLNQWNFVGATYSYPTGKVKAWHDGIEIGSLDVGTFEIETQYDIRVGYLHGDPRPFEGRIACIQIYNIPLNGDQIRDAARKCTAAQPVGLWRLNKLYGLTDISGNGNDATGEGVALGTGMYGEPEGSYVLSGNSTSYIEIPDDRTLDTRYSLTILASVYPTGQSGPLLHYGDNSSGVHVWQDSTYFLHARLFSRNATINQTTQAQYLTLNQWNSVGMTYDYNSGILKLWSEGLEISSTDIGVYQLGTNHAARIGAVGSDSFNGSVSCVQIYDVALNQSEIEHAGRLCRAPGQPVGLWRLTKQYGLTDTSGNGNDATGEGVALGTGVYGEPEGSYVLSGNSTSYIEIPDDRVLDTRYSLTILASVYPTGQSGPLLHYGDNSSGVHMWQDSTYFLHASLFSRNATTSQTSQTRCLKPNQWNSVGLTYDYSSGILKLWYEGLEISSTDIGVYQLGTNHAARIGAVGSDSFNGSVSCVQIYDVALNQSQIEHAATLCTGNSIALGKPATQSSDYGDHALAARAVDGYTGPINQCTHTQLNFEPWWKLDLGGSYIIERVRLLNRRNGYGERLEEFQVRVGDDSDISKNSICGRTANQLDEPPEDRSITVDCAQPITGRYVSVQLINRTDYLTLCEVEVFVAQGKDAGWLTLDFYSVINSTGTPHDDGGIVYDAYKTRDGNLSTYWHPTGVADNKYFITFDLQEYYWVSKIRVIGYEEDNAATHHISAFTIKTALNTTGSWTDVTSFSGLAGRQVKAFTGFVAMSRYWRVDITQTSHGLEPYVAEIQLYGYLAYPRQTAEVMTFSSPKSSANYARHPASLSQPLTEITTCLQLRSDDAIFGTPVSYEMSANAFKLIGQSTGKFRICVNDQTTNEVELIVSYPRFMCTTWSSTAGDWKFYADGTVIASGSGLAQGTSIPAGGVWILGQEQDSPGGSFDTSMAFTGEISLLNVWDRVLTEAEIGAANNGTAEGNIINWRQDTFLLYGQVMNSSGCEDSRSTGNETNYQWDIALPVSSPLTFSVMAENDVHIALSSQAAALNDTYEIVIGGWNNTQSVIRRAPDGDNEVTVSTQDILSSDEFRGFWISWAADGTIAAGRDGESSPFMQWRDPNPLGIAYFGYSTGWGSAGEFRFPCQPRYSLLMPSYYGFDIYKVPVNGSMISASLRTACEAQGMQTLCHKANEEAKPENWFSYCQTIPVGTEVSSEEKHHEVLAYHLCGSVIPKACEPLHDTFVARRGWRTNDGACGARPFAWCSNGNNFYNKHALCARVSEEGSAAFQEELTYHCTGDKPSYVTMATSGTITSGDNERRNYSSDSLCSWTIEAPSGMGVSLTFLTFDLADDGECLSDYVAVYDGSSQSSAVLGRFCESNPGVVNSTGNLMHVTFVTNSVNQSSGFRASFERLTDIDECANANGGCEHVCTNTEGSFQCSCHIGQTLNGDGLNCDASQSTTSPTTTYVSSTTAQVSTTPKILSTAMVPTTSTQTTTPRSSTTTRASTTAALPTVTTAAAAVPTTYSTTTVGPGTTAEASTTEVRSIVTTAGAAVPTTYSTTTVGPSTTEARPTVTTAGASTTSLTTAAAPTSTVDVITTAGAAVPTTSPTTSAAPTTSWASTTAIRSTLTTAGAAVPTTSAPKTLRYNTTVTTDVSTTVIRSAPITSTPTNPVPNTTAETNTSAVQSTVGAAISSTSSQAPPALNSTAEHNNTMSLSLSTTATAVPIPFLTTTPVPNSTKETNSTVVRTAVPSTSLLMTPAPNITAEANATNVVKSTSAATVPTTPDIDECMTGAHACLRDELCFNREGSYACASCYPNIALVGGGANSSAPVDIKRRVPFTVQSTVSVDCNVSYSFLFNWSLYAMDDGLASVKITLPENVETAGSELTLPKNVLPYGKVAIRLEVTVEETLSGLRVVTSAEQWVNVLSSALLADIDGGSARSLAPGSDIVLDGSFSTDPDTMVTDSADFTYNWTCVTESGTSCNDMFRDGGTNQSYFISSEDVDTSAGRLVVHLTVLFVGRSPGTTFQILEIFPVGTPSIYIRCFSNCNRKINPSEKLVLVSVCTNCEENELVSYNWTLQEVPDEFGRFDLNWDTESTTGRNLPDVVIKPEVLTALGDYTLRVETTLADGRHGFAEYSFVPNKPPAVGSCTVSPENGTAMVTEFIISCRGFSDSDEPLTYTFLFNTDAATGFSPLYTGTDPTTPSQLFPVGQESGDFVVRIRVEVSDSFGAISYVESSVKVVALPAEQSTAVASQLVVGENSPLTQLVREGDAKSLVQMSNSVTSVLNTVPTNASVETRRAATEAREAVVAALTTIKPTSVSSVNLVASALGSATSGGDDVSADAQVATARSLKNMGEFLQSLPPEELEITQVEKTSSVMFAAVVNVLASSSKASGQGIDSAEENATDTNNLAKAKEAVDGIIGVIDSLSELVISRKRPDAKPTVISQGPFQIALQRQSCRDTGPQIVRPTGQSDTWFRIPGFSTLFGHSCGQSISIENYETSLNPYFYANNSDKIKSPVASLKFRSDSGPVEVNDLQVPIDVMMPQKPGTVVVQTERGETTPTGQDVMSVHNFTITEGASSVHVTVTPDVEGIPLRLFLGINSAPSRKVFRKATSMPSVVGSLYSIPLGNNSYLRPDPFQWLLPASDLGLTGSEQLFLGVDHEPFTDDIDTNDDTVIWGDLSKALELGYGGVNFTMNYTLQIFTSACLFFDNDQQLWSTEGCEVGSLTTTTLTHCLCDHLTAFGSDFQFFVAPNSLNILEALEGFTNIMDNPSVVITIGVLFGLYLLIVIWARREDKKDGLKVGATVLEGSNRGRHTYEVMVYTGTRANAGTSAEVFLVLRGELGQSVPYVLEDKTRITFKQGAVDTFVVTSDFHLGPIYAIHIWHNNIGPDPSWYLDQVIITDVQDDDKHTFLCKSWLAVEEGDGKVDRVLYKASYDDLIRFGRLFSTKTSKDFRDEHLWFSVIGRPATSPFTRVQRISCCLSLLMCTMLTNIMFFGRGQTYQKPAPVYILGFQIQFPISWGEIMIGIQSALMVIPVNLLIVQFFRNCAVRPSRKISTVESPEDTAGSSREEERYGALVLKSDPSVKIYQLSEKKKKKKCLLPWWCVFFAWLLVLGTCVVSAFFTMLYGFEYGREKAEAWVLTFLTSFVFDLAISQPLKIILIGFLFALLIKKPDSLEDDVPPTQLRDDEVFLGLQDKDTKHKSEKKKSKPTGPPGRGILAVAREQRFIQLGLRDACYDFVFYTSYILLLLVIANGSRDSSMYHMNTHLYNTIVNPFAKIKDFATFWKFVRDHVVSDLHDVKWYNGDGFHSAGFMTDTSSFLVGRPRLRQIRVQKDESCDVPAPLWRMLTDCDQPYSLLNTDLSSYDVGWTRLDNVTFDALTSMDNISHYQRPWIYQYASLSAAVPDSGEHGTYYGGGYLVELSNSSSADMELIDELQEMDWIDDNTRAVFIEIIVYNANANLFAVLTLLAEFTTLGKAYGQGEIMVVRLYPYTTAWGFVSLGCHGLFLLITLYLTFREVRRILTLGTEYFKMFWRVVELVLSLLALAEIGVHLYTAYLILGFNKVRTQGDDSSGDRRYNKYKQAVSWEKINTYILGWLVCVACLKMLYLCRFNKRIARGPKVTRKALKPLLSFIVVFSFLFMAFCMLGFLALGSRLSLYSTFIGTMQTLFSVMLGKMDYYSVESAGGVLGPLMLFCFVLFFPNVLVMMFLAIFDDAFQEVIEEEEISGKSENEKIKEYAVYLFRKFVLKNTDEEFFTENQTNVTDIAETRGRPSTEIVPKIHINGISRISVMDSTYEAMEMAETDDLVTLISD
ncbi:uncharacterized protein LOC144907954 [Branchiostoma floridae x Branchiostoma belcheri]